MLTVRARVYAHILFVKEYVPNDMERLAKYQQQ